jgi:hypothetical protein
MNTKIFLIIGIFAIITIIPTVDAQLSFGGKANQSIEMKIDRSQIIHVKHIVSSSSMPVNVNLFGGTISNFSIINEEGENIEMKSGKVNDETGNQTIMIFPSKQNSIIEYNLEDIFTLNDNMWTTKISYPQKISIYISEEIDLIFVDNNPIILGEQKGIACHGCNINLQYYLDIPKIITEEIEWEEEEFLVEIMSDSNIEKFNFDQRLKSISFQVNEENKFITITMPSKLLGGPYITLLNDEKIFHNYYSNNETHVTLNMKPESTGRIDIIGTTVIPEFPIFAPLVIGFLIILTLPLMKKFNLR